MAGRPPLQARADAEKLRQILINLLTNAVKFTPAGGRVTLECAEAGADGDAVVLVRVSDTGVGIAADRLATVFEPFVQLDRHLNSANEGIGLGLAISRDLARGMSGDLVARRRTCRPRAATSSARWPDVGRPTSGAGRQLSRRSARRR